jgi:hypothetical protein
MQRCLQDLEEKKARYKTTLEELNSKNKVFIEMLEKLTGQHGSLVENAATTVRKMFENTVNTELIHYESLNMLAPDKAKIIKNFQIKQEMQVDIKAAEDQSYKIDLHSARQKLLDLPEGATTHQTMLPYCQYVSDTTDFYTKLSDKWAKYLAALTQFFTDLVTVEKHMSK